MKGDGFKPLPEIALESLTETALSSSSGSVFLSQRVSGRCRVQCALSFGCTGSGQVQR